MKDEYDTYKMDSFKNLMQWAYTRGWYDNRLDLVTVVIQGEFEGFSGRASETWEQQFIVSICEVGRVKAHSVKADTLEYACQQILLMIEEDHKEEMQMLKKFKDATGG
jgi:hypothetical protein